MIRFALSADVPAIMDFIHREWKEHHILARDEDFFHYEHGREGKVNFVISTDENKRIDGLLGFIPTSLQTQPDICTVIWKVSKIAADPVLGINLLRFLTENGYFRSVSSVGINEKTVGIYQFLGMHTGQLNHYALINPKIESYKIAVVKGALKQPSFPSSEGYQLNILDRNFDFNFSKFSENILFKDAAYLLRRYFDHPIYKYQVYGITKNEYISGLLVTRVQEAEGSRALRIVDFIGIENELKYVSELIYRRLIKEDLEYADFYCYGLNPLTFKEAGFDHIDQNSDEKIIPNYFYPFLRKNVKIFFFSNTENVQHLKLFKGDGDQDRPN